MSDSSENTHVSDLSGLLAVLGGQTDQDPILATQEFIQKHPDRSEGYFVLGVLTYLSGYVGDAMGMIERAHDLDPDVREYAQALSSLYSMSGRLNDALYFAKLGVVLDTHPEMSGVLPADLQNFVESAGTRELHSHYVKAALAFNCRNFESVIAECDTELKLDPSYMPAQQLKASAFLELEDYVSVVPLLQQLIEVNPSENSRYRIDLSLAMSHLGLFEHAREMLETAIQDSPDSLDINTKALSLVSLLPEAEPLIASAWANMRQNGADESEPYFQYTPFTKPNLHIGFLTDKCYECFEGRALSSLLKRFSPETFKTYVYIQNINEDYVTQAIKNHAGYARDVFDINDKTLALIMQRDSIDILVDMCGFGANHRLPLMAHKPGGVRINWLAPTYGFAQPTVNYVVAEKSTHNAYAACLGNGQEILMLDGPLFAREEIKGFPPPVAPPVLDNGYITFGVQMDFRALCSGDGQVWARLLEAVPNAKMKINVGDAISEFALMRLKEIFDPLGLTDRIELHSSDEAKSLGDFSEGVDLFLVSQFDHISTIIETLWMGIPCLTYQRDTHGAIPMDAAILRAAGIPSWVCKSVDDFVAMGVSLASNTQELSGLRTALRPQVAQSALMNADNFAQKFQEMLVGLSNKLSQTG